METRAVLRDLMAETERLLENNLADDALILLKTAAGNIYHQTIHCVGVVRRDGFPVETASYETEVSDLLSVLRAKNDTHVQCILAVSNGHVVQLPDHHKYSVELPPYCIRKGLIDLDQRNADAIILTDGVRNMTIGDSMPPLK